MSFWRTFADLATRQPEVEAILAPARLPLSFGELPARLDRARTDLNGYGIGRGDLVAIALPKGPEMAVCTTAVTSCAIAAPLNPEHTDDEFARYLARLRPKTIILPAGCDGAARRQATSLSIPIIDLAVDPKQPAGSFDLRSEARNSSAGMGWNDDDDVALILMTSGSTGRPKLVAMRQRHIAAYTQGTAQMYGLDRADRCIHAMPMFHGHGVKSSLLVPLLLGSGVVCPDRFDVPSFFAHVQRFRPTWYSAGYTIHHAILDQIDQFREVARAARLRFIRSGSGRLDPRVMQGLEDAFGAPVVERYGMSETGTLTYNPLPPRVRKPGSVGIPCSCEVRVVDERGAVLGANREGEVVARGPSVFDGYWDAPEDTEAAFKDGWFRTGDLGRFDEDGYLTITGRIKDLINRGGEKFSPIEIETILCEHPKVDAACVFPIPHSTLGEEVVAAVVPVTASNLTEQDVMLHARSRLASFKVPRRVLLCATLPKGNSGKVHRANVAQMCRTMLAQGGAAELASPSRVPTALEREILQIWNVVLKTNTTEIDQDFFLSGGDSIKAADLFARVGRRLGVTLALSQIFDDATTVSGIARLAEKIRGGSTTKLDLPTGLVPIKTDGHRAPLFALPGNGGNPLGFVHLGRLLHQHQPLYGIESPGLDGSRPPLDRLEDIAADNIRSLKALQPEGPYYLAGACFGGRVAYEIARQLNEAGDRVDLLLLLDPSPPFTDGSGRLRGVGGGASRRRVGRFQTARFILARIELYARQIATLRGPERRAYLRGRLALIGEILKRRDLFRGDRSEIIQRSVQAANRRAGGRYIPGPYSGKVILCLTRGRHIRGDRDYRLDWLHVVPQCGAPVYVDGTDSGGMLKPPHVYALSDQINGWLNAAFQPNQQDDIAQPATLTAAR